MAIKHPFLHAAACSVVAMAALPMPAFGQQVQSPQDAAARYQALAAEESTKAGDPAFDYALGTAASDAGHYGEAIVAFQRVLARQPSNAPARAELARAYALAGDIDTARDQFSTVVDDSVSPGSSASSTSRSRAAALTCLASLKHRWDTTATSTRPRS